MNIVEFIKTFSPFTMSKAQERLLTEIENEDPKKPISFGKRINTCIETIVVPMKTLIYELPKMEPFNPDIRYSYRYPTWNEPYQERCTVRRPMMRDWVRHVCREHDIVIRWE